MILDFQNARADADRICRAFVIMDLDTDKPLEIPVWFADEDTGACRAYRLHVDGDDPAFRKIDPVTKQLPSISFVRSIAFVPKPGMQHEAAALRARLARASDDAS